VLDFKIKFYHVSNADSSISNNFKPVSNGETSCVFTAALVVCRDQVKCPTFGVSCSRKNSSVAIWRLPSDICPHVGCFVLSDRPFFTRLLFVCWLVSTNKCRLIVLSNAAMTFSLYCIGLTQLLFLCVVFNTGGISNASEGLSTST